MWASGCIVYAAVVIIANLKLLYCFNIYTFWGELLVILSIISYFFLFWGENMLKAIPDLYGTFAPVMTHPITYYGLFMCGAMLFTVDKMFDLVFSAKEKAA